MGTAARLTAAVGALVILCGLGWGVGRLAGPVPTPVVDAARWHWTDSGGARRKGPAPPYGAADSGLGGDSGQRPVDGTDGLASAAAGYRLVLSTPTFTPGIPAELRFSVLGPDDRPVTAYTPTRRDPSLLHVVVIRRDVAGFRRLDPTMDPDGVWRAAITLPAAGVWRAFVDTTPAAGPPLVLGADLFAPGPFTPFAFDPSRTADIGGYRLRLDGDLVPGVPSQVFATVSQDGEGVTTLQPYLGAFGRAVVLREGDLAYSVGTPGDGSDHIPAPADRAGPALAFTVDVPSDGVYRLFLQFQVADGVHTAEFTLPTRSP